MKRISGIIFLCIVYCTVISNSLVNALEFSNSLPFSIQTADQKEKSDTLNWEYSLRTSFTGSQATYKNWSQGGVDNISLLGTTVFASNYKIDHFLYGLSVNMRYGQSRIGSGDFLKSDDQIRIRNQFRRLFRDEHYGLVFNLNFESQFDKGVDPDNNDLVISRFFAPAYVTQMLGMSYNPDKYLRFEAGLAMKQTFVQDTSLSARYGLDEGVSFRNESGFSLLIGYDRSIMESIHYSGFIETFTNINKSLTSSDILFTNEITGRINRFVSANIEFAMAYNDDITDALQIKQIISVGFSYIFFDN